MSLEKWELSHHPGDKDKNRWLLKLKIDESSLEPLIGKFPPAVKPGRPFILEDGAYDFGFYLYESGAEDLSALSRFLEKESTGGVQGARNGSELESLLDKVAHGFDSALKVPDGVEDREPKPGGSAQPQEIPFEDLELNPRYTFENFIIGPNNRFTAAAAQAVADNLGKIYNPFFIYSNVGLGKTHLMTAVGHTVKKKDPSLRILYVTTEKFMGEVIDSIRAGSLRQMREHYRQVDLLLVDDIHFLVESESTQEEFFHTFNVLHQSGKQIIITSDRPPKQLTTLEDRLRSRFEWGLIADIKAPSLETRVAILKKKGEIDKLILDDNILLFIASKLKSNIRELEGFLKRINAYATLTHQEVSMDLVRSLMSDLLPAEEAEEPHAPAQAKAVDARPPAVQPKAEPAPAAAPRINEEERIKPEDIVIQNPVQPQPPAPVKFAMPPAPASENDMKVVDVAFFYPQAKDEELAKVKERFSEVIKKHKLKFHIKGVIEQPYDCSAAVSYPSFTELCKKNNAAIAIVLGPPADSGVAAEDFANMLATVMEDEKISLQLVPWSELGKDYRYLNLALDITLLRHNRG